MQDPATRSGRRPLDALSAEERAGYDRMLEKMDFLSEVEGRLWGSEALERWESLGRAEVDACFEQFNDQLARGRSRRAAIESVVARIERSPE